MTAPARAPERTRILLDAAGRVTQDEAAAVRGEIIEKWPDGRVSSTVFVLGDTPSPFDVPPPG